MSEELLIQVLCQWEGDETSFGQTLYEATRYIPSWYIGADRRDACRRKNDARKLITAIEGGYELLRQEEKLLRR